MSEAKRYTMDCKGLPFFDEDGVYVLHEDYEALAQQLAATTNSLTNAQEALKSAGIEADTVQAGVMELVSRMNQVVAENGLMLSDYRDIPEMRRIGAPLTPATDAHIRELRNEAGARAVELFSQTLGSPYSFRDEKCYEDGFTRAIQVVRDIQAPRFATQLRAGNAGKDGV